MPANFQEIAFIRTPLDIPDANGLIITPASKKIALRRISYAINEARVAS